MVIQTVEYPKAFGKSRTTIIKYLAVIETSGFSAKELLELKEADLSELLEVCNELTPLNREEIHKYLYDFFPYAEKELKRIGVTRKILWNEYKMKYPQGVMYNRLNFRSFLESVFIPSMG